jgi:UDPglucose 6-dehydrogenase
MIGFAGLSHLGLVSSIGVASRNFKTIGYDPDVNLIEALSEGKLPVFEPGLEELLKSSSKSISFTADISALRACDVVYISIDVKTADDNTSDLTAINSLIQNVSRVMKTGSTLVVLSQVPPGFTRKIKIPQVNIYYQVETLIFGNAVERTLKPERYIIGTDKATSSLPAPYETLLKAFGCPILPMRYESAELAKISINMFLSSTLTMTNTLAELCEKLGADWTEIAPAMRLDKRIGPHAYLGAGLGISGGNIERDLISLIRMGEDNGSDTSVVRSCVANSRYRKDWPLRTLAYAVLERKTNPKIAIWGLAYKQDTHSTKNSPSVGLLESLTGIKVAVYDPQAKIPTHLEKQNITRTISALEACDGADALVIMTPWSEFKNISVSEISKKLQGRIVIDPFGVLSESQCQNLGLTYYRLGVPNA